MKQEGKKEQLINWILAGGFVAAVMLIIGSLFDYYYDLNDDGLMKDILAGVYTGLYRVDGSVKELGRYC